MTTGSGWGCTSTPAELVAETGRLGLAAVAVTGHDGIYGVPQFAQVIALNLPDFPVTPVTARRAGLWH